MDNHPDFLKTMEELDAGLFHKKLNRVMADTALAVVSEGKKGSLTITIELKQIGESSQVAMRHSIKADRPTPRGNRIENDSTSTPLYVSSGGKLSFLPDTQGSFDLSSKS